MLLGAASLGLSILVLNVHHSNKGRNVPQWVQVTILTLMAGVLCMKTGKKWHSKRVPRRAKTQIPQRQAGGQSSGSIVRRKISNQSAAAEYSDSNCTRSPEVKPKNDQVYTAADTDAADNREQEALYQEAVLQEKQTRKYVLKYVEEEYVPEWRDVSRVLDRLFFCMVLMAMLVSSALTLCAPYYANS